MEATKLELSRVRDRGEEEIAGMEKMAQEHCSRATRLAGEVNHLRGEMLRLKKEIRWVKW